MKPKLNRRVNVKRLNLVIIFCAMLPAICLAAGTPAPEVIKENSGLFQWVLGIALLGNGIFIMRTLNSLDRLWKRTDGISKDLAELRGEHQVFHRDDK